MSLSPRPCPHRRLSLGVQDNSKVGKLTTLSAALKKEIGEWKAYRSSNLNRLRVGTKVAEVTHEHEVCPSLSRVDGQS